MFGEKYICGIGMGSKVLDQSHNQKKYTFYSIIVKD